MNIGEALLVSLMGIIVVFFALAIIMCAIIVLSKAFSKKTAPAPAAAPAPIAAAPEAPKLPAAAGSCGDIKTFDVPDKIAAMLMAIVADKMGAPLNELRFKSIKEISK